MKGDSAKIQKPKPNVELNSIIKKTQSLYL